MAIRIPDTLSAPPNADGRPYVVDVVYDGWRIRADSADDALRLLIEGYADLRDDTSRLRARRHLAVRAAVMVQTLLNATELFDQNTDEESAVLLGRVGGTPKIVEWGCAVPLVLVTSSYEPTGTIPRPRATGPGQVWWIDPSTGQSLLRTLHQTRWLDLTLTNAAGSWAEVAPPYRNLGPNGAAGYRWRKLVA
jgi:hypothetical protein